VRDTYGASDSGSSRTPSPRCLPDPGRERGPGQDTHWSTQSTAAATGMSQSAISRIWRSFGWPDPMREAAATSSRRSYIMQLRQWESRLRSAAIYPIGHLALIFMCTKSHVSRIQQGVNSVSPIAWVTKTSSHHLSGL
jgi:hypothetical protein